jgi:hypothetical protein
MNEYTPQDYMELVRICEASALPLSQDVRDMEAEGYFKFADNQNSLGIVKLKKYLEQNYPEVYSFVYFTALEDVPLEVSNEHLALFVKWRLRIAK